MRVPMGCGSLMLGVALLSLVASVRTASARTAFGDADITLAVERQFMHDPAVPFNGIDVNTENGIVRLSGQVGSFGAKMQALRIAETVKGVRAAVDEITVEPTGLAPEQIQRDVTAALATDPATRDYHLTAMVDANGTVTLLGTVHSWAEHEIAAHVAGSVRGVRGVDNDIELDFLAKRTDSQIQADIRERLRWDTLVDDSLVHVSVTDGFVTLSGIVGSAAEARRAALDARVTGVRDVKSDALKVERWARDEDLRSSKYVHKSDEEIRKAVQAALLYDPRVSAFPVDVGVDDGQVRLSGAVGNLKAKRAAADTARNTVGVIGVDNYLHVRPADHFGAQTIEDRVREAFMRDALIDSHDIVVDAHDGVVSLFGAVDSPVEKSQAEDVASRVTGVTEVRNYLTVERLGVAIPLPSGYGWYPYDYSYRSTDTPAEDAAITANIRQELYWSPYVDQADVAVEVDDGVATLTGTVKSRAERAAAVASAYEGGARRVKDEVKLGTG